MLYICQETSVQGLIQEPTAVWPWFAWKLCEHWSLGWLKQTNKQRKKEVTYRVSFKVKLNFDLDFPGGFIDLQIFSSSTTETVCDRASLRVNGFHCRYDRTWTQNRRTSQSHNQTLYITLYTFCVCLSVSPPLSLSCTSCKYYKHTHI